MGGKGGSNKNNKAKTARIHVVVTCKQVNEKQISIKQIKHGKVQFTVVLWDQNHLTVSFSFF